MSNINFFQLSEYKPPVISEKSNREEWVAYGDDNDYFQYLIDRYTSSTTNNAIINNICKLAYGKGLGAKDSRVKPNDYARLITIFSKDAVKRVISDAKIFGNAAFQIIYEKGEVKTAEHIPVQLLRAEKCNDKGEIEAYWYSDNWDDLRNYQPKRIKAFGYGSGKEIEIYYFGNYSVGQKYYSLPDYVGALPYAKLEEEVADYLINEVQNSFAPTTVVNFNNGVPEPEKMELMVRDVKNTLTGSKGKKVVVSFNSDETKKTTVDSIPLNDAPDHYTYLSEECQSKIMLGHNVTSPLLFGIASTNGFSSNADELRNSYILFENMVIKPLQELVLDAIDEIMMVNKISLNLYFKHLQPLDAEGDLTNETNMSSQADDLVSKGHDVPENWILIDESEVDYDLEDELDLEISKLNNKKQSFMQRLASTITARPNSKSEQDANIDGIKFYTRYKYTGNPNPQRDFCVKMMGAGKIYRKEDIINTNSKVVNDGFGHEGQAYDLFLYKGGPRCHHKWVRQTYVSAEDIKIDVNNPKAVQISTNKAEKAGYRVRNPKEVAMMPKDMPNEGFYPTT